METTENNKIIAEFMGHHLEHPLIDWYDPNGDDYKYNSSWDWLMEVVEKIESLGNCQIDISFNWCKIGYKDNTIDSRDYLKSNSKIQAVYNACLEFIKWYNENAAKEN